MTCSKIALVAVFAASLSACGASTGDRAVTGGAIGAGTGAAVGLVTGGSVGGAALVGGAVGAATGAVTDESQIDLGDPVYE